MGKKRKLLNKILAGSRNIRFGEFTALIEAFGFIFMRISGSHHVYRHPAIPQTIAVQPDQTGQAKPYQIRQIMALVEEFHLRLSDPETDTEGDT